MNRLEESQTRERDLHQRAEKYQEQPQEPQNYFQPRQPQPMREPRYEERYYRQPMSQPMREPTNVDILKRISALDKKMDKSLKMIALGVVATFIILIATTGGYL